MQLGYLAISQVNLVPSSQNRCSCCLHCCVALPIIGLRSNGRVPPQGLYFSPGLRAPARWYPTAVPTLDSTPALAQPHGIPQAASTWTSPTETSVMGRKPRRPPWALTGGVLVLAVPP